MKKFIPILEWLPRYDKTLFFGDLMAGITVGIMLIPQGMAYAMLAGLPPIYGLYASTIPLIIYAALGTSPQLAVGPVAMVSLMVASGVGAIAELGSESFITLAILLALMVGVIQLVLGIFKLGFLVKFLSHPVISGFTSAAALIIGFSQLKHLLGLDIPRGKIHETILNISENIGSINFYTLVIGVGAISIILLLRKINRKIPSPLIVVLLGIGMVYFLNLNESGVQIIEDVPSGFPLFDIPALDIESILLLLPIALAISLVSYMESYAVAKAIQSKHKDYTIDPNQELIGLGTANIVGSFFSSFPVTGGFSRTAVNDQAGARSGVAALISAGLIILTLLFLTSYFYYLPNAVLAAIIMVAVFGLIDFKEAIHLWHKDKLDFLSLAVTALTTLFIGIEPGIGVGVLVSLLVVLYRITYPHVTELGEVPNEGIFRNVNRFNNLQPQGETLLLRFDAQLFFANCDAFKNAILEKIEAKGPVSKVVVEASGIHHMDSSSIHMIQDLTQELRDKNITLQFSDVKGPLRDIFQKNDIYTTVGESNFFLSSKDAMESISNNKKENKKYIFQSSISQN